MSSGTYIYSSPVKSLAKRMSFAEVICPLQHEKKRRRRAFLRRQDETYLALGYSVSISNDRKSFGVPELMVAFDSRCVNCTKNGLAIECVRDVRFVFIIFLPPKYII